MKQSALNFEILFTSMPCACIVLDTNYNIVAVTDMFNVISMTKREDLIGKNHFTIFKENPEDRSADGEKNLRGSLQKVLETKAAHRMPVQKYDIKNANGQFEERYWSPYNQPLLNEMNEVEYILHKVEDVSELIVLRKNVLEGQNVNSDLVNLTNRMEAEILDRTTQLHDVNQDLSLANAELIIKTNELKRSNDELANFAMIASHDIQAPFRIVGQYLEIIHERILEANITISFTDLFEKIYAARQRIKNLLDDLLRISLVSKSEKLFTKISLEQVFTDVLSNLEAHISESGAKIIVKNKLPVVEAEGFQQMQLFQNLISNAIKFNESSEPVVEVDVRKDKKIYIFSIKDNGVGIDSVYFDKVFEAFQRLNTQRKFPGTGLGLAICKKIVENHRGRIWVESEPGKGTTFYFTLPTTE